MIQARKAPPPARRSGPRRALGRDRGTILIAVSFVGIFAMALSGGLISHYAVSEARCCFADNLIHNIDPVFSDPVGAKRPSKQRIVRIVYFYVKKLTGFCAACRILYCK